MRDNTKADKLWSILLLVLPCVVLLLSMIPGMLRMYDEELEKVISCNIFTGPATSAMPLLMPLFLILFGITILIAVLYFRGQTLTTIRSLMIATWVSFAFTLIVMFLEVDLKPWPFAVIPIILGINGILVTVRHGQEEDYFYN